MKKYASHSGFTLIELSIVLVIVGLLVGGVVFGKELIKSAERRALLSEIDQIKVALATFKDKYRCEAGDCPNATQFFGKNTTLCNAATGTAGSPGTCNGNGNNNSLEDIVNGAYETESFWQHLILANLVSYPYSGVRKSKFTGKPDISIAKISGVWGLSGSQDSKLKLVLTFTSGFSIADLVLIDRTMDDGLINSGKIQADSANGYTSFDDPDSCVESDEYWTYFNYNTGLNTLRSLGCLMYFTIE